MPKVWAVQHGMQPTGFASLRSARQRLIQVVRQHDVGPDGSGTLGGNAGGQMRNEFTAVVERDGRWHIAYSPEIPGANGQGRTKAAALNGPKDLPWTVRARDWPMSPSNFRFQPTAARFARCGG